MHKIETPADLTACSGRHAGKLANFIIIYSGREGSSAIVSMLSAQKSVHVPLFEELDAYNRRRSANDVPLPQLFDSVFKSGAFGTAPPSSVLFPAVYTPGDSIGFKNRLRHPPDEIAPVLIENNVKVFVLSRRDFAELVASSYFNAFRPKNAGNVEGSHPQFQLIEVSGEERDALRSRIGSIRLLANFRELVKIAVKKVETRERFSAYARKLADSGVDVVPIYYEDFVTARVKFIRAFLGELGLPADWPVSDQTKFAKVLDEPATRKLTGPGWYFARMALPFFAIRYRQAQRRLERHLQRR